MPRLDCTFASCGAQVAHDNEDTCVALYNAHIATHVATGADVVGSKSKAPPLVRPRIEVSTSLADWEFFKSRFKSFKVAADVQPEKAVHELMGCLDNDLLKLLYRESEKPEGLNEEDLLRLIKHIAMKSKNVWCLREKLHQMSQDTGELVSSFAARL